jgi:transcriptional regulator with XRE-family HTH domain
VPASVEIVASEVRRLRKARGWSQEAFAARCNLHRTYVGAIERAEENLTLRTLDKLAQALKVKPVDLLVPHQFYPSHPASPDGQSDHPQRGGKPQKVAINRARRQN